MMKKISVIFALICSVTIFAQNKINEGVVTSVQKMSSPNPEVSAQLAMVGDVVTITEFKKNKSRAQMASIMMGNTTTVLDADVNKMLVLSDNPTMGKTFTLKDIKDDQVDLDKFEIIKGENTKTVLGYECQEYIVTTSQQGAQMKMTVFTTESVEAQSQQIKAMGSKLKGYPMYMKIEMNQQGMDMVIESEVTKIEEKRIEDDVFSLEIPEGYKEAQMPVKDGQ